MKIFLLTLTILLTGFTSCEDKQNNDFIPTLPPITQTGENTFGCYIDGKLLTPRDGAGGIYGIPKGMIYSGISNHSYNEIAVHDRKSNKGGLLRIHIANLHQNGEGSFVINESNCNRGLDSPININVYCRVYDETVQLFKWYCSIENAGTIIITKYDLENRIVSGTFSCTVQNQDNSDDQIEITDGRFDIRWDTLDQTIFP